MLKKYLNHCYSQADNLNKQNIRKYAKRISGGNILDIGCNQGEWTLKLKEVTNATETWGIEINSAPAMQGREKGLKVVQQDLDHPWQVPESFFDLIHGNQVIEHVRDVDRLAQEAYKALRPGGRLIISTENGSSWHNVFASIMGWQMFSLTNMSSFGLGIGNPLALHRNDGTLPLTSWTHKVIFNYLGLVEFFKLHGFESIEINGAGYHPLPAIFGRVDVRHAHFITLTALRPRE